MSDEPYAFGPTDPRTHALPTGRPDAADGTDARAWGAVPAAQPSAASVDGGPGSGNASTGGPAPWGAKPPVEGRKRMSTMAKSLTAVGVAAVIAVGGTVAVTSANADNTTAPASAMQPMGGEGFGSAGTQGSVGTDGTGGTAGTEGTGRSGGFGGGMASRSLLAGALHGDFVVADGTGTVTERLQTGSVSSISSTSLTVKSTDDFTATYAIPSGTDVSSLTAGTTVTVVAKVEGSTATVVSLTAAVQGGTNGGGTGGFTPPDGSAGSGSGTTGGGTGGTGSGGTGTAPGGSAPGGTAPGGSAPGGSAPGSTGTTGEDSGV